MSATEQDRPATSALKQVLLKTPAYGLIKSLYRHTLKREYLAARAKLTAFYRPLIKPGALVFDVGANRGDFSDAYLRLGARVVAVEPHPVCAMELAAIYGRNDRFELVQAALGAAPGEARLYLGENGLDNVSSVSQEYIQEAGRIPGLAVAGWNKSVSVRQETLDVLIRRFGLPDFCKIDVEGYEIDVLKGLTQSLPLLQFEYQPWAVKKAVECVQQSASLGMTRFNITLGSDRDRQPRLLPTWMGSDEMVLLLHKEVADRYVGDVFVAR